MTRGGRSIKLCFDVGCGSPECLHFWQFSVGISIHLKGLILAQNERWRRGLGMQVEREGSLRGAGQRQTA